MAARLPVDVDGHMSVPQMAQLDHWVRKLRVRGPVVEVGCYKGRSAAQFGVVCQKLGRHLICIDPWIDGSKPFGEQSGDEVFQDFLDNMAACGLEHLKDFTVHRMTSMDALPTTGRYFVLPHRRREGRKRRKIRKRRNKTAPAIKLFSCLSCDFCQKHLARLFNVGKRARTSENCVHRGTFSWYRVRPGLT